MFILDAVNRRLRVLLGGAGAIPFVSSYVDISTSNSAISGAATTTGVTNGVTPVDLVPVPPASTIRQVKWFTAPNTSGGAVALTVRYDDNGTNRDIVFNLDNGDILQYTDTEGFRVFTSAGALKGTGAGGVTAHASTHQHGGSDYLAWSIVSPGSLGASQNDWAPGNGDTIRATSSTAVNITGLAGGTDGMHRRIVNIGANNITLKHQDVASVAGNRFLCQGYADILLAPDEQADLWYDSTTSRWRAAIV